MTKETLKLMDLTKVRLWVEMHPKVVLFSLSCYNIGFSIRPRVLIHFLRMG